MLIAGCAATKAGSLAGTHAADAQPRLAGTIDTAARCGSQRRPLIPV